MEENKEDKKTVNGKHARFQDAKWFDSENPLDIIVGGTGGTGSWASMFLGRIGHTLYLYDNDLIDLSNMAGQLYSNKQIGLNKAQATKANIELFSDHKAVEIQGLYDENSPTAPVVFSCFDNMSARKLMFNKWKEQEDRELFVDARQLAEVGMIFCVQKGQEALYETELFDDSEVEEAPCSFKATSHCGALTGSLMVSGLNNYLVNKRLGEVFREVPFKFTFELALFNFQIPIPELLKKEKETKLEENVEV